MRFFFPKLYKTLNVHTKGKEKKMYVSPFYKGVVHFKGVFFDRREEEEDEREKGMVCLHIKRERERVL